MLQSTPLASERDISSNTVTEMPRVSVVINNYNYRLYIDQAMDSVFSQTYSALDCIIVDDGSTDGSQEFIKNQIQSNPQKIPIRLIEHSKNRGQLAAFLTGLEAASGEFVVFLDADDVLFPNFIETHVRHHLNKPVAFTSSNCSIIDGKSVLLLKQRDFSSPWEKWQKRDPHSTPTPSAPPASTYIPSWETTTSYEYPWGPTTSLMFRRSVFDAFNPTEFENWRVCADSLIVCFAQALGGSLLIREPLWAYRRHRKNSFLDSSILGDTEFLSQKSEDQFAHVHRVKYLHVISMLCSPGFYNAGSISKPFLRPILLRLLQGVPPEYLIANVLQFTNALGAERHLIANPLRLARREVMKRKIKNIPILGRLLMGLYRRTIR